MKTKTKKMVVKEVGKKKDALRMKLIRTGKKLSVKADWGQGSLISKLHQEHYFGKRLGRKLVVSSLPYFKEAKRHTLSNPSRRLFKALGYTLEVIKKNKDNQKRYSEFKLTK